MNLITSMPNKLSIPPSPSWETLLDVSIRELPKKFKWRAMMTRLLHYPNISFQADSETTKDFQEELSYATQFWNTTCRHPFPCPHGRQTLSKKQRKQPCGKPFGQSLCGLCILHHVVNEKRDEMELLSSEDISAWYFSDDDESDSDDEGVYYRMQLRRTPSGTLQFTETYLETLQTGITASSAA